MLNVFLLSDNASSAATNVEEVFMCVQCTFTLLSFTCHRQKGMVINICASIASAPPTPLMTVYQAAMVSINKDIVHEMFYYVTYRTTSTVFL